MAEVLAAIPTVATAGLVRRPARSLASMHSSSEGRGRPGRPRIWGLPGSWHMTSASAWAPWSSPRLTPAKLGWKSEPWPSITSQWSASLAGQSHSMLPEMKSATTPSTATPSPAMKMPDWPVARKLAFSPRRRISFSMARAVNILPSEQSVPTVSTRLPCRGVPLPTSKSRVGWRTSNRRRPWLLAAAATSAMSARRRCMPAITSRPASRAATMVGTQPCGTKPPALATPTSMVRQPAAAASAGVMSGSPRSSLQPARRSWAAAFSGRQMVTPVQPLIASGSRASPRNSR